MKKPDLVTNLKNSILQLEVRRAEEELLLKTQFDCTIDSFKPINMIKSTFTEAIGSGEVKNGIINTTVGLTAGVVSKLIFSGVMKSPLRKLIGTGLMMGITEVVARNPETVKSVGKGLFNLIRKVGSKKSARHVLK